MKSVSILFDQQFFAKHRIVQVQIELNVIFSCFLNQKFIWMLRVEDMEDIKMNIIAQLSTT